MGMENQDSSLGEAFLRDFKQLLAKYNATFDIQMYGEYDMHEAVAEIDFNSEWDEKGNQTRKYLNFALPSYIKPGISDG